MPKLKDIIGESFDSFRPKAGDEQRFWDKHVVHLFKNIYSEAEYDKLFKATNIKAVGRSKERHGYETGKDAEVYESVIIDEAKLNVDLDTRAGKAFYHGYMSAKQTKFPGFHLHRKYNDSHPKRDSDQHKEFIKGWKQAHTDNYTGHLKEEVELFGESHVFNSLMNGAHAWKKRNKSDDKIGHVMKSIVDTAKECNLSPSEVQDWIKAHPWEPSEPDDPVDKEDEDNSIIGGSGPLAGKKRKQARAHVGKKFAKHLARNRKKDAKFDLDSHESLDEDLISRVALIEDDLAELYSEVLQEYHYSDPHDGQNVGQTRFGNALGHAKDHVMGIAKVAKDHGFAIGAATAAVHGATAAFYGANPGAHALAAGVHATAAIAGGAHHAIRDSYKDGMDNSRDARFERRAIRHGRKETQRKVRRAKRFLKGVQVKKTDSDRRALVRHAGGAYPLGAKLYNSYEPEEMLGQDLISLAESFGIDLEEGAIGSYATIRRDREMYVSHLKDRERKRSKRRREAILKKAGPKKVEEGTGTGSSVGSPHKYAPHYVHDGKGRHFGAYNTEKQARDHVTSLNKKGVKAYYGKLKGEGYKSRAARSVIYKDKKEKLPPLPGQKPEDKVLPPRKREREY